MRHADQFSRQTVIRNKRTRLRFLRKKNLKNQYCRESHLKNTLVPPEKGHHVDINTTGFFWNNIWINQKPAMLFGTARYDSK